MKLLASRASKVLAVAFRFVFFGLSRLIWGQPIFNWALSLATVGLFIVEFEIPSDSSVSAGGAELLAALAIWLVTFVLAVIFVRASNRAAESANLDNQVRAARQAVRVEFIWLALIALFWWANGAQVAGEFSRVVLAVLLLTPSFALTLVFLQRGLHDTGFEADVILLSKTGTLTHGSRKLSFVQVAKNSPLQTQAQILSLAAGLESDDPDDLAQAISERVRRRALKPVELKDVMSIPGLGMSGRLDGTRVVLGGPDQLVAHNTNIDVVDLVRADQANSEGQTVLYLLLDGVLCGYLGFADEARKDLKFYVQLLQYRRKRVVVYSGDAHETTRFFANELGCTEFYGEVLPHEHELLVAKISADGSRVIESHDVYETALQIEKAVRDRRLQWLAFGFTAATVLVALITGVANLGGGLASILVPAMCSLVSLLASQATVIVEQRIWPRLPKTILVGQQVSGSKDE